MNQFQTTTSAQSRSLSSPRPSYDVSGETFDQPLGADEVLIKVTRSMIHPGDLQLIAAHYSDLSEPFPSGRVPGFEAAGIIERDAQGDHRYNGIK